MPMQKAVIEFTSRTTIWIDKPTQAEAITYLENMTVEQLRLYGEWCCMFQNMGSISIITIEETDD